MRVLIAAAVGLLAGGFACAAEPPVEAAKPVKVVVIPIRNPIAKPELYILRRGIKDAIENRADTVVLDMETPGGDLESTFEILKALEKFPGRTVTYVNREAMSAGALISAGTDEIYFAPGAVIGAAAPVMGDGTDIGETMKGKLVSYLTARMRSISEGKGYRGQVISAMIDMDSEFRIGDSLIKEKGRLLSLTASEAMKLYGDPPQPLLGSGIAGNLDELLDRLHGPGNHTVQSFDVTWSERLAQYLVTITPLLLGVGLLALFIEFKTPGFGFFGITGIVLLGIVFAGQYVAGLSGHEPALFFVLGMALLAAEVFLFPGVFVLASVGVMLMLGSLVWAMSDLWPGEGIPVSGGVFTGPLLNLTAGCAIAVVLFVLLLRFLPKGGLWGNLVLEAAVAGAPDVSLPVEGGHRDVSSLVGETGVAATGLFPSGQVEIAGRRYEARVAVGFAEAGKPVRVTGRSEFGLIVEVAS